MAVSAEWSSPTEEWGDTELTTLRAAYAALWRDMEGLAKTRKAVAAAMARHVLEWPSLAHRRGRDLSVDEHRQRTGQGACDLSGGVVLP